MSGVGVNIDGPGIAAFIASAVAFYSATQAVGEGTCGCIVALALVGAGIIFGGIGLQVEKYHTRAAVALKAVENSDRLPPRYIG